MLANTKTRQAISQQITFETDKKQVVAETNGQKAKYFAKALGRTMQAKDYPEKGLDTISTKQFDELTIDIKELSRILKTKRNTAPGEDNIRYEDIRKTTTKFKELLCNLHSICLNVGVTPTKWKQSNIKLIPKPNKNRKNAKNYRPLSMTSCMCKILETAVKGRLETFREANKILGENRTAYRKNRRTISSA